MEVGESVVCFTYTSKGAKETKFFMNTEIGVSFFSCENLCSAVCSLQNCRQLLCGLSMGLSVQRYTCVPIMIINASGVHIHDE